MRTKRNLIQICLLITVMQYSVSVWAQNLFESDSGSATIYQFTPSGAQSNSAFVAIENPTGGGFGPAYGPGYLTFDSAGNLFVAIITGFSPSGIRKYAPNGTESRFAGPVLPNLVAAGLAFDNAGNLYVTDQRGYIYEYTNGVNEDTNGTSSTRGIFSSVLLTNGQALTGGMAFDSAGNLFVASYVASDAASAHNIYNINIVAGAGSIYEINTNGTVSTFAAGLTKPECLAFNKAGALFASDALNGNIYEFTPDGTQSTFDSGLSRPWGLAFDSMGDLFVACKNSGNIYEYTNGISSERGAFATGLNLPTYLAFQPPPPPLGISTYNSQPAIFFPTATGTNFVLQMSTNLASGNWVTVSNGIPISGLIITNPPAAAFFRLY